MSDVCVITGGGSGMGLAAAKFLPKEKIIIVSGRTESKLNKAVSELTALGMRHIHTLVMCQIVKVLDL